MKDQSRTTEASVEGLVPLRDRISELEKLEAEYKPEEEMKVFIHRVDQLMYQGKKRERQGSFRIIDSSTVQRINLPLPPISTAIRQPMIVRYSDLIPAFYG